MVHAFGVEYVRLECGGIRSIAKRMINQANFGSFMNTRLTVQLFWYWNDDTLNNLVNNPVFRQSIHYQTIYKYAENKLKVWLKNIDDINALGVPTFGGSPYIVPTCTIKCEAVVEQLISDCEFEMSGYFTPDLMPGPINDKYQEISVTTELVTAGNQFWIENYDIAPESLSSNTSRFYAFSSISINIKHVNYGAKTEAKLNLERIPRTVRSFLSHDFWKSVATNDHSNYNDSQHATLLLADLPPRIEKFVLDGAFDFYGTISFDDLPISTKTVSFGNSKVTRISVTKKFDIQSQLRSVSVLSPNLKGYLDLQLFQCFRRKISTIFKFNKELENFSVKNDRDYYCRLE